MAGRGNERVPSWPRCALFFSLLVVASNAGTPETHIWFVSTSTSTSSMTKIASASFSVLCGSACQQLEDCWSFCFDEVSKGCYVSDPGYLKPLPEDASHATCYEHVRYPVGCPVGEGYTLIDGDKCLKLVDSTVTYQQAKSACWQDQAHLYFVKSSEDRTAFATLHQQNAVSEDTWVGADALATGGNFVWNDGTQLLKDSSLWANLEPRWYSDNCVFLFAGALVSFPCDQLKRYVCQVDM